MSAECCGAGSARSTRRTRSARAKLAALLALAPGAALTLWIPKCPLCLAAELAWLGTGAGLVTAALSLLLCLSRLAKRA